MIVIIGMTASGKDTIVNKLVYKYGYSKVVTYTTRPMRIGEIQGTTYHFISNSDFYSKIDSNFFAEWKSYDTIQGKWYYGSAKEDYTKDSDKSVIILTPDGYRDICKVLEDKPKSIYIYSDKKTIKDRLLKRGDNKKEAKRRLKHDLKDFAGIKYEVDKVIYNNNNTDIDDIVDQIICYIEGDEII